MRRLPTRLFGHGASRAQKIGISAIAITGGVLTLWQLGAAGLPGWRTVLTVLIAADVFGGALANALPPLQRFHRRVYGHPRRRWCFRMAHLPHLMLLAWPAPPVALPWLGVLAAGLFFKLFVTFPSWSRRSA